MERFKAYAEGVQEMNAILSSDYTVALSGRLRADAMLNVLLAHGVTPDMFMSDMSFKSVDALISNYTGASLAFKLMQIPKQATSFIGGFQQYRFGDKPNPVTDLIMFFFDYAVLVPQMMLEGVTLVEEPPGLTEVVEYYIEHRLMPAESGGDAVHLALASMHSIDFLLTWNCRHLANANKTQHLAVLNGRLRLHVPVVTTPLTLMPEERR